MNAYERRSGEMQVGGQPRGAELLGLGCWPLGGSAVNLGTAMGWSDITDARADAVVQRALDEGIRRFDTADAYGIGRSEQRLGHALDQARGRVPRSELRLTSKVGYVHPVDGSSPLRRENLLRSLETTLRRLHTDYLDVYFLHHNAADRGELEQFVEVVHQLRSEGVLRAIGSRGPHRFSRERTRDVDRTDKADQFQTVFSVLRPDVVSLRANLLSPLTTGAGSVIDWVREQGSAVQIYKPLAQGLLTDRYVRGFPTFGPGDHRSKKGWFTPAAHEPLVELLAGLRAAVPGYSPLEVALGWVDHIAPGTTVLVGSTDPEHIGDIVAARRPSFTTHQVEQLLQLAERYRSRVPAYLD